MAYGPLRFKPWDRVTYALVAIPKAGMGPRGPDDRRPIRLPAQVICQGQGPGPHNVLLEFANGSRAVTTWAHCRRVR